MTKIGFAQVVDLVGIIEWANPRVTHRTAVVHGNGLLARGLGWRERTTVTCPTSRRFVQLTTIAFIVTSLSLLVFGNQFVEQAIRAG